MSCEGKLSQLSGVYQHMNKYERTVAALDAGQDHTMKVFGHSMMPIIKSGSALTFRKVDHYEIGDVVLSKVKGRWIDATC